MVTSFSASSAAVWYMTDTTGSPLMLAAMSICSTTGPQACFRPSAAWWQTRFNRKAVLIAADMAVGLVSLAVGFVVPGGRPARRR